MSPPASPAGLLRIIREMKLLYDSSLMADDEPYELTADGEPTGIVELPPEWIKDDAVYFNMDVLPNGDLALKSYEGNWKFELRGSMLLCWHVLNAQSPPCFFHPGQNDRAVIVHARRTPAPRRRQNRG